MDRLAHKSHRIAMRKTRTRTSLTTSDKRLRLSVRVSNRNIIAQVIDDTKHKTLAHVTTSASKDAKGNMTEKAAWAGTEIAKKAKAAKVKKVVLDRGSKLYHGRIKAFADAAREGGLEF